MLKRKLSLLTFLVAISAAAFAGDKEHGTVITDVMLHVSPDPTSQQLSKVTRGRDIFLMDHTMVDNKPWAHLLAVVDVDVERETAREISGWVPANTVVTTSTPNGDQIIYGEAVTPKAGLTRDAKMRATTHGGFTTVSMNTFPTRRWRARPCGAPPISCGIWKKRT